MRVSDSDSDDSIRFRVRDSEFQGDRQGLREHGRAKQKSQRAKIEEEGPVE